MPVIIDRRPRATRPAPPPREGRRRVVTRRITAVRRVPVVVPPKPLWRQVLDAPPAIRSGLHWYQRVPPRLRKPEPAARLAVAGVTVWFGSLFVMLGVLAGRADASDGHGEFLAAVWSGGFYVAALLGLVGLGLFLTRRHRVGLALVGAMFALSQVLVVAAII